MSIVTNSSEMEPKEEKEDERRQLMQSGLDMEVPSSPLGASACRVEDSDKKTKSNEYMSSPSLSSDRKRKKGKQLYLAIFSSSPSLSSPTPPLPSPHNRLWIFFYSILELEYLHSRRAPPLQAWSRMMKTSPPSLPHAVPPIPPPLSSPPPLPHAAQ